MQRAVTLPNFLVKSSRKPLLLYPVISGNYQPRWLSSVPSAPAIHQSVSGRVRFYKKVDVIPVELSESNEYTVTLDGRKLKTPAMAPFVVPNMDIALSIAAEWDAQTDKKKGIQPADMPMMTLASTAIDQVKCNRDTTISNCMKYLPTDSALFMTTTEDRILLARQKQHLQPVVRWLTKSLGVRLDTTSSIAARLQHPEKTIQRIETILSRMDHFSLACLQSATYECKSLVLGLAYIARNLTLEQVKMASRLEEEFQLEVWGVVEGGHDMDRLNNSIRLSSVGCFMALYKDNNDMKESWKQWTGVAD